MGRSLPSSPKATWLTSDFPAGKAAGCFPQEKCPCSGPCPPRATLVPCPSTWAWPPAVPTVHAPLLCASPCLPPAPSIPKGLGSLLQHPHYQDGLPQAPCPMHRPQARRMSPEEQGLFSRSLHTARQGRVLVPTPGLGLAQLGPGPWRRSGAWDLPTPGQSEDPRPRGTTCPLQALPGRLRSSSCPLWPMVT